MSNELIISATQDGCRIALLKDKQLVEFHEDQEGSKFVVGDIYLGTVKKVVQGLNAGFIDIGYEKDAFLHYLDLGAKFSSLQKFTKLVRAKKITGGKLDKFQLEKEIDKGGGGVRYLKWRFPVLGCCRARAAGNDRRRKAAEEREHEERALVPHAQIA